ncbi:AI-2E family transporter [Halogeometricum luteum]|uniref:AI-2E family transporter n=1 Tax=Halogeometricum luteum TaxID=2950537 RepID=A0ABU2FVV3_9EURY|nr:AI-2E family transporter [Halogeometricum sp. S3BR5-2]MDS0292668.1 AI-2E family transporter [Halogeometricum sp. S3BR5-2]
MNVGGAPAIDRRRVGWWLVAAGVAGIVGLFLYSFVGTFVLGLFVYYGARPVNRRIQRVVGSRGLSATVTLLFIVVPTLALLGYAGFVALRELTATLDSGTVTLLLNRLPGDQQTLAGVARNFPQFVQQLGDMSQFRQALQTAAGALGTLTTGLLHLTLALAFAFFLYRDGHRLQAWYRKTVGGRDTAAYSYLAGVDADLEVVYFGNVLTVLAVTLGSMAVYNGYNVLAPSAVELPFPTLLAVLTGLATFVPLVVGKLVYVPATALLAWRAVQADGSLLVYPAGFLVVVFLLLDILPQSVVRPYISGQTMHEGAVLFAYILGTALFGWYGLFLGPLLLVIVVQFANFVLEDLLWGRPFSPLPTDTTGLGTDPRGAKADTDAGADATDGGSNPDSSDAADEAEGEDEGKG